MACADPAQQLSRQGAAPDGTAAQQAPAEELPALQSAESIARQVPDTCQTQNFAKSGKALTAQAVKIDCKLPCDKLYRNMNGLCSMHVGVK